MKKDGHTGTPHTRSWLRAAFGYLLMMALAGCAGLERRPPPTLDEVVQMSAEGMADEQIIEQMRQTRAVYPLDASQIVELSERGVSKPVLDYMHRRYVEHVRRQERLMYGDPFWGYPCVGCRYPYWRVPPYYFPY